MGEPTTNDIRDHIESLCFQLEKKRSSAVTGRARSSSNNFRLWFMLLFRDLIKECTKLISPTEFWAIFGVKDGAIKSSTSEGFEAIYEIVNEHPNVFRDLQAKCDPDPTPNSAIAFLVASEKESGRTLGPDECIALLSKFKELRATS